MSNSKPTEHKSVYATQTPTNQLKAQLEYSSHIITPPPNDPEFTTAFEEFVSDNYDFIYNAASIYQDLRYHPRSTVIAREASTYAMSGGDALAKPGSMLGDLLTTDLGISRSGVRTKAQKGGIRGIGLGALSVEASLIVGASVGAEVILMFPYKIGTYTVPTSVYGRAWAYLSGLGFGADVGFELADILGFSFWRQPPVSSKYLLGTFLTATVAPFYPPPVGFGFRFELIGVIPKKEEDDPVEGGSVGKWKIPWSKLFKYINGIRFTPDYGLQYGLGAFFGAQLAARALDLSTFVVNPNNMVVAKLTDLSCKVTAPSKAKLPNRLLVNKDGTQSSLVISFPSFMNACTNYSIANHVEVSGMSSDWKQEKQTSNNGKIVFIYQGIDQAPWTEDLTLTVSGAISNQYATSTEANATASLYNIATPGDHIESNLVSPHNSQLNLVPQGFEATINWQLTLGDHVVPYNYDSIVPGPVKYSTADANANYWYPIYGINSDNEKVPIEVQWDKDDTLWFVGFVFEPSGKADVSQIQALFWKVNSRWGKNQWPSDYVQLEPSGTAVSEFARGGYNCTTKLSVSGMQTYPSRS